MARIASKVLIERLADWGVDTVFGLPGDGIDGIMEGLRRHQDRIRFVLVHHKEAAADTLLLVGTNFPYTKHLPHGARAAQIEADPAGRAPGSARKCRSSAMPLEDGARDPVAPQSELSGVIGEAFAYRGPALVDVDVQPDEPPLPGKVEYEQAKRFAQAFLRGQPRKATIATTLLADKIQELRLRS